MLPKAGLDDEGLVRLAQAGDRGAFSTLVCKYRARVMKLTLRYARNEADAEDIVQEAFTKAYRGLPNFRGEAAFYSWLHRIATNTAKTAIVVRSRDANFGASDICDHEQISDVGTPEDMAVANDIVAAVNSALDALCEEHRRAIVLREIEGLSYRQVATAMSCPVGTVRSRVFRARETIHLHVCDIFDKGLGRIRSKRSGRTWEAATGCAVS